MFIRDCQLLQTVSGNVGSAERKYISSSVEELVCIAKVSAYKLQMLVIRYEAVVD